MKDIIIGELQKLGVGKISDGRNGWLNCRCPFHKDNDPSFGINSVTGGFNCFGCGIKGKTIKHFLSLVYGKDINVDDFISGQMFFLSRVNSRYNRSLDDILCYDNETKFRQYHSALQEDFINISNCESAYRYLFEDRKLTARTIKDSGIMYALKGDYAGRLIFPMGLDVGFHSRLILTDEDNSGKWKMCVNNTKFQNFVYGMDKITDDLYCIICESVLDRLYLIQNGYKNVITTLSTNFTTEQYMNITRFKKFIFCYDMDDNQSGQKKSKQHTEFILKYMYEKECYIVQLPLKPGQKKKDPNDCTPDELRSAFAAIKRIKLKE